MWMNKYDVHCTYTYIHSDAVAVVVSIDGTERGGGGREGH